jgi:hypothetical protein
LTYCSCCVLNSSHIDRKLVPIVGHRLSIEKLFDAVAERRMLWALYKRCGRSVKFDSCNLVVLLGDAMLRDMQDRLRCRRCQNNRRQSWWAIHG